MHLIGFRSPSLSSCSSKKQAVSIHNWTQYITDYQLMLETQHQHLFLEGNSSLVRLPGTWCLHQRVQNCISSDRSRKSLKMACAVERWVTPPDIGGLDAHTGMGKLQSKFRRRSDIYKWDMMSNDVLVVMDLWLLRLYCWQGQRGGGACTCAPGSAVWTRSHRCHQLCRQPDLWPVRVRRAWPGELEKRWIGGRFGNYIISVRGVACQKVSVKLLQYLSIRRDAVRDRTVSDRI